MHVVAVNILGPLPKFSKSNQYIFVSGYYSHVEGDAESNKKLMGKSLFHFAI